MKTYIIGENSEIVIKPEYVDVEKEDLFLYAYDTKIEMYKAADWRLPIHIRLKKDHERDSSKCIDIILNHKNQIAALYKAFEEYLSYPSDDDNVPERPKIAFFSPETDFIKYSCPVCHRDLDGYGVFKKCPTCKKTIDWGKKPPHIIRTLSWEDEENE